MHKLNHYALSSLLNQIGQGDWAITECNFGVILGTNASKLGKYLRTYHNGMACPFAYLQTNGVILRGDKLHTSSHLPYLVCS